MWIFVGLFGEDIWITMSWKNIQQVGDHNTACQRKYLKLFSFIKAYQFLNKLCYLCLFRLTRFRSFNNKTSSRSNKYSFWGKENIAGGVCRLPASSSDLHLHSQWCFIRSGEAVVAKSKCWPATCKILSSILSCLPKF